MRRPANRQAPARCLRAIALTLGSLFLICSTTTVASATVTSTNAVSDKEPLFAPCAACHGARGEGNSTLNAPAIAGQDAVYIERQLRNFRNRRRGADNSDAPGIQMQAAAAALTEAAIAKVARYVASLPKTFVANPASGNLHNGNNLYQGKCGACHGGRAEGNPALNAPRLAGLDAGYLKRQFAQFRDGVRGTDPQDEPGRQMAMMAKTVTTEGDLDDIIAFIHQQGRPK
jgi:cytochrome c553